ncbi:MAG: TPM domain-containing protein [Nitrococcus sp.]|nr:TPM domain-containing protein [Nitrococcus sp.]
MALLSECDQQEVAAAITRVERETDAEVVTVLAAQADDYAYIPLLWAGIFALVAPGALNVFFGWWNAHVLLLVQWASFIVLSLLFRIPGITTRLIPRSVRHWRASNLARRQFLEHNLHQTQGGTGMLIFVSEAERYVEILVDQGISSRLSDDIWQGIVATFTQRVRQGQTLQGFLACIDSCGQHLKQHLPATHERDELPNHLVILS